MPASARRIWGVCALGEAATDKTYAFVQDSSIETQSNCIEVRKVRLSISGRLGVTLARLAITRTTNATPPHLALGGRQRQRMAKRARMNSTGSQCAPFFRICKCYLIFNQALTGLVAGRAFVHPVRTSRLIERASLCMVPCRCTCKCKPMPMRRSTEIARCGAAISAHAK